MSEDADQGAESTLPEAEDAEPRLAFDAATMECVLDVRALCSLPQDSDEDGAMSFRALLLPKGKTVHVPDEPGCYATLGPWHTQIALSLVHFVPATARKPELLLSFVDYGMLNDNATGIFVMSLQLPLQKSRNVFEETPRFTKISDVCGFSPIEVKEQPWCSLLQPALKRQSIYEDQHLYTPADIVQHLRIPLATRLEGLDTVAREGIAAKVAGLSRQDKRQAEKAKARMEAQLDKALQFLRGLPPKKYDRRMNERIILVKPDVADGPAWLTTPQRAELESGAAECKPTARAVRRLAPAEPAQVEAAAAAPAAPPAATAAEVPVLRAFPAVTDPTSDSETERSEPGEPPIRLQSVKDKRTRKATAHFEPEKQAQPKKAKASTAAELKAAGINPRTKEPYKRGGKGYNSKPKSDAASVLAAVNSANKHSEKAAVARETVATLKGQIATLTAQLAAAKAALEASEQSKQIAIDKAKADAAAGHGAELLARYKEGIRDGASLANGNGMSPALGAGTAASPATY